MQKKVRYLIFPKVIFFLYILKWNKKKKKKILILVFNTPNFMSNR